MDDEEDSIMNMCAFDLHIQRKRKNQEALTEQREKIRSQSIPQVNATIAKCLQAAFDEAKVVEKSEESAARTKSSYISSLNVLLARYDRTLPAPSNDDLAKSEFAKDIDLLQPVFEDVMASWPFKTRSRDSSEPGATSVGTRKRTKRG